jgi:hypothetical protein
LGTGGVHQGVFGGPPSCYGCRHKWGYGLHECHHRNIASGAWWYHRIARAKKRPRKGVPMGAEGVHTEEYRINKGKLTLKVLAFKGEE